MPDQTQATNNQMIIYALIAIAVLLAAIVGFMIYGQTKSLPAPTTQTSTAPQNPTTGNNPPATTPGPFDPKTATKLPAGMTPAQALKAYNEDILAHKYTEAYKLLPRYVQVSTYGSEAGYEQQVSSYGITSYKMGQPQASGGDTVIVATQVTPQMPITYTWTYTKIGSAWYIKSRVMGGTAP